jgi:hypothetical protein
MADGVFGAEPLKVERCPNELRILAIGAFVLFAGLDVYAAFNPHPADPSASSRVVTEAVLSSMALIALACVWWCWRHAVTLWPDRVESHNGLFTRSLKRSDIEGYLSEKGGRGIRLVGKDSWHSSVSIPRSFLSDPRSKAWFQGIPSLARRYSQAVVNDRRPGETADMRQQTLAQLKQIAKVLDWLGYGIGLWALFWPQPYTVAILCVIAAPPAALALKLFSHQMLSLSDEAPGDSRPRIQGLFLMPAIVLALRALLDINLLDWQPALLCSLLPAALLAIPLFAGDRQLRQRPFIAAFMLVVLLAYSWAGITELNTIFDTSFARVFPTAIQSRHVSHGKSTSYHVVLDGWDGRPAGDDVRVRYGFYASHHPGERICVRLHNGWLGFRYIELEACW